MEVLIVSEVEVLVTVVSPYNADVRNRINNYPFSYDIDKIKKRSQKHGLEATIEMPNPKFSFRVFPTEKEPCATVSMEKGRNGHIQSEPVAIQSDVGAQNKTSKKSEKTENVNLHLETEALLDYNKCSVDDDEHVSLEQLEDITAKDSAAHKDNKLKDMNLLINKTLGDNNTLVVGPTPVLENITFDAITTEDSNESIQDTDLNRTRTTHIYRGYKTRKSERNKRKKVAMENFNCTAEDCNVVVNDLPDSFIVKDSPPNDRNCKKNLEIINDTNSLEKDHSDKPCVNSIVSLTQAAIKNTSYVDINDEEHHKPVVINDLGRAHTRNGCKGNKIRPPTSVGQKEIRVNSNNSSAENCNVFDNNLVVNSKMEEFLPNYQSYDEVKNVDINDSDGKDSDHSSKTSANGTNGDMGATSVLPEVSQCNICNKDFSKNFLLQRHLTSHRHIDKEQIIQQERRFKCDVCFKDFKRKEQLQIHQRVHTGERPYACSYCNKQFRQKIDRKRHEMIHTGENRFKCRVCDKKFLYRQVLKDHETIHTNNKTFMCEKCGKGFTCDNFLKRHSIRSHTKSHLCNICGKAFARKAVLDRHFFTHSGLKPYLCSICGFKTADSDTLFCHLKQHTGETPFSCDLCDKKFVTKYLLRKHLLIHDRETRVRGYQM